MYDDPFTLADKNMTTLPRWSVFTLVYTSPPIHS